MNELSPDLVVGAVRELCKITIEHENAASIYPESHATCACTEAVWLHQCLWWMRSWLCILDIITTTFVR